MNHINIDKIFVVNLDDKIHRWKHFSKLDGNIERISAVDSRANWYIYEDYGLELVPYGRNNDHYFTQSKGAVGCYLSHYIIWKKIVDEDINWTLILEDDAEIESVKSFISREIYCKDSTDVIQLNNRSHHDDLISWFNGTESYAINKRAAQILIDATHDFSYFKETPCELLPWRVDKFNLSESEYVKDTVPLHYCWQVPNAIRIPADKHIGYCGHLSIELTRRIGLENQPSIDLYDTLVESDVTSANQIPHWNMTHEQLGELEARDDFEWWMKKDIFGK